MDKQAQFDAFLEHHVMTHAGSAEGWNLPFLRVNALEWLHYDAVVLFVIAAILILLGIAMRRRIAVLPKGIGVLAEEYLLFIRDQIVYPNFGPALGRGFIPFFCTLFLFLVLSNILGLIPIFNTVTGSLSVTAAFSLIFFAVSLFSVVRINGFRGFKAAFLPSGLPVLLRPVMVVMEAVSFCTRTFALAVRLFANMLGGHMVLYAILGLTAILGWQASPSFLMGVLLYLFEVFVALLQAYVFTLLSAIFMGMMVRPEH